MINSRKIDDLHPKVAIMCNKFIAECDKQDIDILITSTYRDAESQNALYAQGRTKPGRIVTNAKAGQSWHNWKCAFDVVPLRNGKPVWGTIGKDLELWNKVGAIGESVGLEWAGRWKRFKEFPHFQFTSGLTLADFQAGKTF
jgi:peptidoglycan L-alanyl-D-glutamate endopeptidase CwlK